MVEVDLGVGARSTCSSWRGDIGTEMGGTPLLYPQMSLFSRVSGSRVKSRQWFCTTL
jgi:hypothetical protein